MLFFHSSIIFSALPRVAGVLEPVKAVTEREAGYSLDSLSIYPRVNCVIFMKCNLKCSRFSAFYLSVKYVTPGS